MNAAAYGGFLPPSIKWIGDVTRTDQYWGMFAPFPLKDDGWFIVDAHLADGSEVDLLRDGAPVQWTKPPYLSSTYPDALWQKYYLNLWSRSTRAHRPYYATYMRRIWDESHPATQQVKSLEIIYMREDTLPDYAPSQPQKVVLWRQTS